MKYYYLSRPPSIGTQPAGFVEQETWHPKERRPEEFPRGAYGWVKYDEPLTFYQAWKYDLMPGGDLHSKVFQIWQEYDRDPIRAEEYIKTWYDLDLDELEKYEDSWTLILIRNLKVDGYTFKQIKELLRRSTWT